MTADDDRVDLAQENAELIARLAALQETVAIVNEKVRRKPCRAVSLL